MLALLDGAVSQLFDYFDQVEEDLILVQSAGTELAPIEFDPITGDAVTGTNTPVETTLAGCIIVKPSVKDVDNDKVTENTVKALYRTTVDFDISDRDTINRNGVMYTIVKVAKHTLSADVAFITIFMNAAGDI